jgi:outer membrane lipopolysaccharide assembly protein LptE/RlpB
VHCVAIAVWCVLTACGAQFNFRTKKLAPEEKKCVVSCSEKWIGATQRITRTFVEQQWLQGQQKAQEQQNKQ